ncbi:unnamed protein product [Amoebophrya sp. A25]|nr:unnamed protein product [Amoebophrya sp. A25]|eukprot:GSA25T00000985001.1
MPRFGDCCPKTRQQVSTGASLFHEASRETQHLRSVGTH